MIGARGGIRTRTVCGHYPLKIACLPIPPPGLSLLTVSTLVVGRRLAIGRLTAHVIGRGVGRQGIFLYGKIQLSLLRRFTNYATRASTTGTLGRVTAVSARARPSSSAAEAMNGE